MIRKDTKERIKSHFFLNPTVRLRVRQVERAVKVPLPSAIRYAKELEAEGVLKRQTVAGVTMYSADRTSRRFLLEKKLYNIQRLFSSGLIHFLLHNFSNFFMNANPQRQKIVASCHRFTDKPTLIKKFMTRQLHLL